MLEFTSIGNLGKYSLYRRDVPHTKLLESNADFTKDLLPLLKATEYNPQVLNRTNNFFFHYTGDIATQAAFQVLHAAFDGHDTAS